MKTSLHLSPFLALTACALFLSSCELPPRESWQIIQRDGLLTYWSREYNPAVPSSRYLGPRHGTPFRPGSYSPRVVPYRQDPDSRYMVERRVPYRPRTVPSESPRVRKAPVREAVITETSKMDPAPPVSPKIRPAPTPSVSSAPTPPPPPSESIPYGASVPGRPGMVTSPFAQKQQLVDVTGMASGEIVKDPYSGKLFRVPPTQQAAAPKTEPVSPPPASEPGKEESKPQP